MDLNSILRIVLPVAVWLLVLKSLLVGLDANLPAYFTNKRYREAYEKWRDNRPRPRDYKK